MNESYKSRVEKINAGTLKNIESLIYDTQNLNLNKKEKAKYDEEIIGYDEQGNVMKSFENDINGFLIDNTTY